MKNDFNNSMSDYLTLEEYLQSRPTSVRQLVTTSIRIMDTFATIDYGKTFEQKIMEFVTLDKDSRQEKIISMLLRFASWCRQDHPEVKYSIREGSVGYHKKKQPRTIMAYVSIIRDILESVYGIEIHVRNLKKKLKIPDPNEFDPEPLTKEELRMICDYSNPEQKLLYMVLKDSGMRIGETVAIRKKHVDTAKDPIEIHIPAQITKKNRSRITFVTRETSPMLNNHLKKLNDEDLVFGENQDQNKAADLAGQKFWRLRKKLATMNPKFGELYEENGLHKKTIHSIRAFTSTQCAEAVDDAFGHAIIGHKPYLGQYIRNQGKMAELYKRAENHLMIYQRVEIVEHDEELKKLQTEQINTQRAIKELFALQSQRENLVLENQMLVEKLRRAEILVNKLDNSN